MKRILTMLAAGTALTAGPALAQNANWTGFYAGAEFGFGDADADAPGPIPFSLNGDGLIGGLTFGYDYDFGTWVVGAGVDYDWTDFELVNVPPVTISVDTILRVKLRGGYKLGNGLAYGTAGYTSMEIDLFGDEDGYFIGGGYEHMVSNNVSLGGEVLYHDLGSITSPAIGGALSDADAITVQARATYRF